MNKLYTLLLSVVALLLLAACGPAKDRVRIEGTLSGVNDAEFYVYSEDGAFDGIDTIRISDGKFTYERKLSAPAVLTLLYPNFTQTYIVAEPGHTVKMKGDASKIGESQITGTEQNELLSDFRTRNWPRHNLCVRMPTHWQPWPCSANTLPTSKTPMPPWRSNCSMC